MPQRPPIHRPVGSKTEAERKAEYTRRRDPAVRAMYNRRWEKLAAWHKVRHPLCEKCLADGRTMPMAEVDHIIPHKGDKSLMYDRDNLQSLCKPCHSHKTATEDSGFARRK